MKGRKQKSGGWEACEQRIKKKTHTLSVSLPKFSIFLVDFWDSVFSYIQKDINFLSYFFSLDVISFTHKHGTCMHVKTKRFIAFLDILQFI